MALSVMLAALPARLAQELHLLALHVLMATSKKALSVMLASYPARLAQFQRLLALHVSITKC